MNMPPSATGLLADADHLLCELAEQPDHPERDHLTALATAHALAAIAAHLIEGEA